MGVAAGAVAGGVAGESSFFPGIIPAAINEISEIMQQLGKPTWEHFSLEYDDRDNLIGTTRWTISKLDLLILLGGPTFIYFFYAMLERMAKFGSSLSEDADEFTGEMLGLFQKLLAAQPDQVAGPIGKLWGFIDRVT